ncbi:hypothetical protein ACFWY9_16510 [Amycolatopsis sp. NPDC059027]|uniref:hypothetical protein n=1 Tax=Amycolatopsis sp. NPDC059027 TaxID=3346709 RepID=UPI00366B93D7
MSTETEAVTTLPPGFTRESCLIVTCGDCHNPFGEMDDVGVVHFATLDEATRAVTDAGWQVTPDHVQCSPCTRTQTCRDHGHAWPGWRPCGCGCAIGTPSIPAHAEPHEWRYCKSCGEGEDRAARTCRR